MTKTITVNAVDRTALTRLPEMVFSECAFRGQVGMGQIVIDDIGANFTIGGMKTWSFLENAASQTRVMTGWTNERRIRRGPFVVDDDRQWVVTLFDLNTFWDDILLTAADGADRPAETDFQRMTWLLTTAAMTSADYGNITSGFMPNSGTENMGAMDYRGQPPRSVAEDCAQISGKNFFLYWDTGAVPKLFYDDAGTSAGLTSTTKISSVLADVNNSTVWAPIFNDDLIKFDPTWVRSKIKIRHKRGTDTDSNATTASNYRQREHRSAHHRRQNHLEGGRQATRWVNKLGSEVQLLPISIIVPAANVNDIRAGQRVQLKIPAAGISAYTYYRVIQRDVSPAPAEGSDGPSDVLYKVGLTFIDDVRPTSLHHQPHSHQGTYIDEQTANSTEDDASVIIDRGGITVTNGAITVSNPSGLVIIDGTSLIFQIAQTGTLSVPKATTRGSSKASVLLSLGITYDPFTQWSMKVTDGTGETWAQALPVIFPNDVGQIIRMFTGRARLEGANKTRVQGFIYTSHPPEGPQVLRYYVLDKAAF